MPHDPAILAFDTSAAHCAAALLVGDDIVAERHEDMTKGQAERLFGLIQEVLAEAKMTAQDLTAIGVGTGPGNFTGIRISVSAARGLALALDIPAIGVSSLTAQAYGIDTAVWSLIDARRDHVYAEQLNTDTPAPPLLLPLEEALKLEGDKIGPNHLTRPAVAIAKIAAHIFDQGAPFAAPAPRYIRDADAAPPRDPAPVILD